jgi:hypothetical protein
VVTPGSEPRVHGYDVERDLARHYRFSDVTLLALVGRLPSDEQFEAFDAAMSFLAPLPITEAPTHAAVLARICGAQSSGVIGAAAVALAERREAVGRLRAALVARKVLVPSLHQPFTRESALVATLWFAGLTLPRQLEAAIVLASLPTAVAEAQMHEVASFREYPMQLPSFEYEDP